MKENKITKMVEQLVRTEYIAEDGMVFYNEEECKKYEESALFAVSSKLKRITKKWTSQFDLYEHNDEEELEIFDVQTKEDLDNLKRYLYLKAIKNGAGDKYIKEAFTSVDGVKRKDHVFDSVTIGHEVLIFWGYEGDWFWVYKDGSLNGYLEWVRERYAKIIAPIENTESEKW